MQFIEINNQLVNVGHITKVTFLAATPFQPGPDMPDNYKSVYGSGSIPAKPDTLIIEIIDSKSIEVTEDKAKEIYELLKSLNQ